MDQVVLNEALDFAIKNYQDFKKNPESVEFNNFFVVVVRLLCIIYGELDIINPYITKDGKTFDINLTKYGFELDRIIDLKEQIQKAFVLSKTQDINPYFISIQKVLIDMLMAKKDSINIDNKEIYDFYDILYTPNNKNPLQISYNFLNAKNEFEIEIYFKEQMIKHQKVKSEQPKVILNPEAYSLMGLSIEKIENMDSESLNLINHQVYSHFGIKETDINKEYLLEEELEKLKKAKENITSGNGYVDILLIISIISTILMCLIVGAYMIR